MSLIRVRFQARVSGLSMAGARLPPLLPPLLLLLSASHRNPASPRRRRCCCQRCSHYAPPLGLLRTRAGQGTVRFVASLCQSPPSPSPPPAHYPPSLSLSLSLWLVGFRVSGLRDEGVEKRGNTGGPGGLGAEKETPPFVLFNYFSFILLLFLLIILNQNSQQYIIHKA